MEFDKALRKIAEGFVKESYLGRKVIFTINGVDYWVEFSCKPISDSSNTEQTKEE